MQLQKDLWKRKQMLLIKKEKEALAKEGLASSNGFSVPHKMLLEKVRIEGGCFFAFF